MNGMNRILLGYAKKILFIWFIRFILVNSLANSVNSD